MEGPADDFQRGNFVPLGGSSRRYVNVNTGETLSRRQYQNLEAQHYGWRNRSDFDNRAKNPAYRQFLRMGVENNRVDKPAAMSVRSAFNQGYTDARRTGFGKGFGGKSASGPFADFLVEIGARDESDTHDVGDTGNWEAKGYAA